MGVFKSSAQKSISVKQSGNLYQDCWNYISSYEGVDTLENVYTKWASKNDLDLFTAKVIWDKLMTNISDMYKHTADTIINIEDNDDDNPAITMKEVSDELNKRDMTTKNVVAPPMPNVSIPQTTSPTQTPLRSMSPAVAPTNKPNAPLGPADGTSPLEKTSPSPINSPANANKNQERTIVDLLSD